MNRKVFDKLHAELSVNQNKLYPRYSLWLSINEYGYDAENLLPEEAALWCRDNGHISLAGKMRKYNPNAESPEDILLRMTENKGNRV